MATKRKDIQPEIAPHILTSRAEAERYLREQIEKGTALLSQQISDSSGIHRLADDYNKWNDFNEELIRTLFAGERLLTEYQRHSYVGITIGGGDRERLQMYTEMTRRGIRELESIVQRLPLIPTNDRDQAPTYSRAQAGANRNVFVVHGHDDGMKQEVARFLQKLALVPVILHEQANQGRTIIEKFEGHADVGFAVVLLTPDDRGGPIDGGDPNQLRARQNVILELGYFIGALGRRNVCALYAQGVELPSDLSGVLYVPIDSGGAWRLQLAREIKASGIDIDLNDAI
jgi:predicted nucleotide-binding protein